MLFFYITILILGLYAGVYTETCPDKENIYPCRCRNSSDIIRVECRLGSGFSPKLPLELLQQGLNGFVGKNGVELKLYSIQDTLPPYFFSGIGITSLHFTSSRFYSLTDGQPWFLGLENSLEVRYLLSTRILILNLNIHTESFCN